MWYMTSSALWYKSGSHGVLCIVWVSTMEHIADNKKEFQEAREKPPKVRNGGSGDDSAAFLCVLCNWLLNIPYQSYCGDRACYNCLKLLAQKMRRRWAIARCRLVQLQFVVDFRQHVSEFQTSLAHGQSAIPRIIDVPAPKFIRRSPCG